MRGTPEDSLVYCTKQDSEAFVYGSLPEPGKRNDLKAACAEISAGKTLKELTENESGQVAIVKFYKGLTVLRSLVQRERERPPFVLWLSGKTGSGKTRSVFELGRILVGGRDEDIWISSGGLRWFDGYDGQRVAIFDDFRSKHVTSFAFLLRLLDRYPLRVEFKGGFVNWSPEFIFITCPDSTSRCFAQRKEHIPEDIAQLDRRIDYEFHFDKEQDDLGRQEFIQDVLTLVRRKCGTETGELP